MSKIWDSTTKDFIKTPGGRYRIVNQGAREYQRLIKRGYKLQYDGNLYPPGYTPQEVVQEEVPRSTLAKIWDPLTNSFQKTPAGREKVMKIGSRDYKRLIENKGYTLQNGTLYPPLEPKKPQPRKAKTTAKAAAKPKISLAKTLAKAREKSKAVELSPRPTLTRSPTILAEEPSTPLNIEQIIPFDEQELAENILPSAEEDEQELAENILPSAKEDELTNNPFFTTPEPVTAPAPAIEQKDSRSFLIFTRSTYKLSNVGSLETFYKMFKEVEGGYPSQLILRSIDEEGRVRYTTISPVDNDNFEDFSSKIDKIINEGSVGSDPLSEGSVIDLSYLATVRADVTGRGQKDDPIFAVKPLNPIKSGLCLWNAVFSQIQYEEDIPIPDDIVQLQTFDKLLKELYGYCIKCYCDWPDSAASLNEEDINSNFKIITINGKREKVSEIDTSSLKVIHHEPEEGYETVSIVYYNDHFIPYGGIAPGSFYYTHKKSIIRVYDDKIVHSWPGNFIHTYLKKQELIEKSFSYDIEIAAFDLETRYDEDYIGLLRPYSISWTFCGEGYFYMGDDCVEKMLQFLDENSSGKLICLVGYNSSRFDNIFLLPAMLKLDMLTDVFYQKNSVLNIRWRGIHTVHDICRFTLASLDRACKEFKTIFQKVGGFDHASIQRHYNEKGNINTFFHDEGCQIGQSEAKSDGQIFQITYMMDKEEAADAEKLNKDEPVKANNPTYIMSKNRHAWPNDSPIIYVKPDVIKRQIQQVCPCKCEKYCNLITYNLFDVISCEELYLGVEKVLMDNNMIQKGRLFDNKTIGSVIYKSFQRDTANQGITLPLLDLPTYKRVRSGLFAGRTQCYKGVSYDLSRNNKYVMLDVKSLYPYVMLNRDFPAGEQVSLNFEECMRRGLIGFYNCRVNQSTLNRNVIPLREDGKPLNWTYKGDITIFLNTVDIKCLIDAGAEVEILKKDDGTVDGFAFTSKINGQKLFACLNFWKKIKEDEDVRKSKNDPEYNPVLRNLAKTFLNSLSGKVIENIHLDKTCLVKNQSQLDQIIKECDNIGNLQLNAVLFHNAGIITYKRKEDKEFRRQNRPLYIGILIYAYARDHMYRRILADYDVIYQDTDSALLSTDEYERFKKDQPEWLGDDFGQFALEDFSELFDSYVTLSPKNYFIMGTKDGKYSVIKKGFKGVNLLRDKYLANPADYSQHIHVTDKLAHISYDISTNNAFDLYNGFIDYQIENERRKLNGLPLIEAPKSVHADWERFVQDILRNNSVYVLTSSLNKMIRTIGQENQKHAGGIYQRFLIKKIKIDKNQKHDPFVRPSEETLRRLRAIAGDSSAKKEPPIDVKQVKFYDNHIAKFNDVNMLRVDFGGENGNRAFNFDSYSEYIHSGIIDRLQRALGDNFNLNEYPSENCRLRHRLWLDIDTYSSPANALRLKNYLNMLIPAGDNKVLRSTQGKLHIILNICPARPYDGGEYILYDHSKNGRLAMLLFFKKKLRRIFGNTTYDKEWDTAFDMKAKGLNAAYGIKMQGGKCISKRFYAPIDADVNMTKSEIIADCSIYKPVTGDLDACFFDEIAKLQEDYEKEEAKRQNKLKKAYECYEYKNGTIIANGVRRKITQQLIEEIIKRLHEKYLHGWHWHKVIRNVALVSAIIPRFNPNYVLHEWSKKSSEYNAERNNQIWAYLSKNKDVEPAENAICELVRMSEAQYL